MGPAKGVPILLRSIFVWGPPQTVHLGPQTSTTSCFLGPTLGPFLGPDLDPNLGPRSRAKFGHARFRLDPQTFLRVGPGPCPAKIWSTLRNRTNFRPSDFLEGRPRAQIQAWGMGSEGFWLCPRPPRPPEKGGGLAQICHGAILPDPQVPQVRQAPSPPPSPPTLKGPLWVWVHGPRI